MTDVSEKVIDEVTDQVDAADVVSGGSVAEQVDGARLGRAVGESVGAMVGRQMGDLLVSRLARKLGFGDEDEPATRSGRLLRALAIAGARTLSNPEIRDSFESWLRQAVADRESADGEAAEGEEAEAAEGEAAEGEETETAEDETTVSDIDPDTLKSLKRDTYRDLLERMEYSELQSLAKDVGVKANVKREELIDRLVEQFGDGEDDAEADEESGSDDGSDEEEGGT